MVNEGLKNRVVVQEFVRIWIESVPVGPFFVRRDDGSRFCAHCGCRLVHLGIEGSTHFFGVMIVKERNKEALNRIAESVHDER
jgi:hypothetical protein